MTIKSLMSQEERAAAYAQIKSLFNSMPAPLAGRKLTDEKHLWLARVHAAIEDLLPITEVMDFAKASRLIDSPFPTTSGPAELVIKRTLFRALAVAEKIAPIDQQGLFMAAGSAFDATATLSKIFGKAAADILVVDPYLDHNALTDYLILSPEKVSIRLLADKKKHKPQLVPGVRAWQKQYGSDRPLEARLSASPLHDRLVAIDNRDVWILTQSLNAFAATSPASVSQVNVQMAADKLSAYHDFWDQAAPL